MRAPVIMLMLAVIAGLYWFRWRPVQADITALHVREDVEQRAVETATLGLQGQRQLVEALRALRRRLDRVAPASSSDPDTDALVDVAKLARRWRLDIVSIGAATVATPAPQSPPGAVPVYAGTAIVGAGARQSSSVPPAVRYERLVTVHGSLANELAMLDGFAGLRPLIEVDGVTLRASIRGGVDAGIAYGVIALPPGPTARVEP